MKVFRKILIANRGEIASRILKAAKELNLKTVAVYAAQDAHLDYVNKADEAVLLHGDSISDTYLNISQIISIAKNLNVDAIHPGYGFLSENTEFARACYSNDIIFIGPDAEAIEKMGDKLEARKLAEELQIPVLSAITGNPGEIIKKKQELSYPLLIKASAGGGGKGMKVVRSAYELEDAVWISKQQAEAYFGNDTIYLERYLENPKHIEIQVFGDDFGNYIHLFERECSVQRRHQKIIEESPSPGITGALREKLTNAALKLIKKINYKNAGTVEFLVQGNDFYFLEMNTRIQVEHPVTEESTGIDLVKEQFNIAQGKPLSFAQEEIAIQRHSIQCRIYAEDPENDFRPSPGEIIYNSLPDSSLCRIDTISNNCNFIVPSDYDPMLTKLIVSGQSREEAIKKMGQALSEYTIQGVKHNITYLQQIFSESDFKKGKIDTNYVSKYHKHLIEGINNRKSEIQLFIPLLATYLFQSENNNERKNIWNLIGKWRTINVISGTTDNEHLQAVIVSSDDKSLKIRIDKLVHEINFKKHSHHRIDIQWNDKSFLCIVSRYKQNNLFEVTVNGFYFVIERNDILKQRSLDEYLSEKINHSSIKSNGFVKSPLNGKAIRVNFKNGDKVIKGDVLLVIESMKTENKIIAEHEGTISELSVLEGEQVKGEQLLLKLN